MSSSINTRNKSIGIQYMKKSIEYISGAVGKYISDVMPVSSSTIKDASSTAKEIQSKFSGSIKNVMPKIKLLKSQHNFKSISDWFLNKENEMDDDSSELDNSLDFDDGDLDSIDVEESVISESEKSANKVSKTIVETTHKLVESQISATANMLESLDRQMSIISAGFDKTNDTLNKILEVVTKNTSTLIESSVVATAINQEREISSRDRMLSNGKFEFDKYKEIISKNINRTELGMLAAFMPIIKTVFDPDNFLKLGPDDVINDAVSFMLNKFAPNIRKNLGALDSSINDTIMTSLIRLGENVNFGPMGTLSRIFGINSDRVNINTSKSSLEIKSVPFDSIVRESIVSTIPGYLQKILTKLGGNDLIYDYRTRSFKSKDIVESEFINYAANNGSMVNLSNDIYNKLNADENSSNLYDLLMTDLGTKTRNGEYRNIIEAFKDKDVAENYINSLLSQYDVNDEIKNSIKLFANRLSDLVSTDDFGTIELGNSVAKSNINRKLRLEEYVDDANAYNVDLSDIRDSVNNDFNAIAFRMGLKEKQNEHNESSVMGIKSYSNISGLNYANIALYEIYRRLDEGINVFRVGRSNSRKTPFKKFGNEFLKKPEGYDAKIITDPGQGPNSSIHNLPSPTPTNDDSNNDNLLSNNTLDDGSPENLSKGQRFARWGKDRGGKLARALFSGSPDDVKRLVGLIMKDVSQVTGGYTKNNSSKINSYFGNVSGSIKHKLFGTEYSYQDGVDENGNPIVKNVLKNELGGVFGYIKNNFNDMFKNAKDKGSKWFSTVSSYFDFGDKDPEEQGVASKRKKILSASVGAFAGAGILGGPLGVIVGTLAGNALSNANIGKKIKSLFFGHDKETGKPTGLISKTADAIISPIKFQIGKTVSFASNMVKKNIFGPLSDIGLAIKDRINNHIDSIFDSAKKTVGKIFGSIGKTILKGLTNIGIDLSTLTGRLSTTLTGKLSRGVLGTIGGTIGGVQTGIANTIAGGNSFHKLKRGEEFTVRTGQSYMDKDGKKRIATHDMSLVGGDTDIKVNTKAYLKQRRTNRNEDIRKDLENSGYYESGTGVLGGIKGFFGGDYNKWHKEELLRRQQNREALKDAMSEKVVDATNNIADDTSNIEQSTTRMADDIRLMTEEATTEGSLFTHDKGLHDRLDKIIEFLIGRKTDDLSPSENISKDNTSEDQEFVNNFVGATTTLMATGDNITDDEKRLGNSIIEEASKPDSNKTSVISKYKSLIEVQKEQGDIQSDDEDKKESIWSKIANLLGGAGNILGSILGNIIPIGGAILAINALLGGDISNTFSNISTSIDRLVNWVKGDKDEDNAALNVPLSLADARVDNPFDIVNPFSTIKHVQTDAAGNDITNYGITNARNQVYLENTRRGLFNNLFDKDLDMMGDKTSQLMEEQRIAKKDKLIEQANSKANKAEKAGLKGDTKKKNKLLNSAQNKMNRANNLDEPSFLENHNRIRGASNIGSGIAVGYAGGLLADKGVSAIARKMGVNDEHADMIGRASGAVVNIKVTKDALTGKGLAAEAKNLLLKTLDFIFSNITKISKFKSIATKLDDLMKVIKDGISSMSEKLVKRLCVLFGKETSKVTAESATAGVGAAVLGVGGALQGGFTTDNLFQIPSGESDAGMKAIASTLGAIFTAAPYVGLLEIVDVILQPITGKTLRQTLAQFMYTALSPERAEKLYGLQSELSSQVDSYNKKFGTSLNLSSYNDMVNRGMISQITKGSTVVGEDGTPIFDEAGAVVTSGGIKSLFSSKQDYARDSEGNVIRDKNGNAVKAVDKYGNKITSQKRDKNGQLIYDEYGNPVYEDYKIADHISNIGRGIKNYFTGKTTYATDEGGNVIYDENGDPVIESKEDNLFNRTKNGLQEGWSSVSVTIKNRNKQIVDGAKKFFGKITSSTNKLIGNNDKEDDELLSTIKNTGVMIGSYMLSPALGLSTSIGKLIKDEKEEKDENGDPILDENGNPIKKGKIGEFATSSLGGFIGLAAKSVKELTSTLSEWNNREYEVDENGKPIEIKNSYSSNNTSRIKKGFLKDFMIGSLGSLTSKIVNPIDEINKGAEEWANKNSPWKKDGKLSIREWIGSKVGSFWNNIVDNLSISNNSNTDKAAKTAIKIAQGFSFGGIGGASEEKEKSVVNNKTQQKEIKHIEENNLGDVSPEDYRKNIETKGTGGGNSPLDFNISGTVEEISNKINTGGNPLNKDFQITSPYGYRGSPKTEFHKGVDLVPSDSSRQAEVGSRFNGTIKAVKSNVADTDHAYKRGSQYVYNGNNDTGNMVQILTDDGKLVTNMHLKAGSIPSSIKPGAKISAGDKIGEMGTTGWSTGPHLHYQIEDPNAPKDPKGSHTVDPMTSIKSGSQVSNFNSSGSTYSASVDNSYNFESSDQTTSSSNKTGVAGFLSAVSELGTKFLNMITGGLFGDSSSSSDVSSGTSSNLSAADIGQAALQLDPDIPIELLTNSQVNSIPGIKAGEAEVLDLKSGISYKIYWGGPPGNRHTDYSTLTPEDTENKIAAATSDGGKFPSWDPRPCILKIAGKQIAVGTHNFNHACVIGGNPGPKCPNKSNTRPPNGWEPGGHFCMYYKDSVNTSGELSTNAKDHQKAAIEAYNLAVEMVKKRKELESSTISVKDGDKGIWDYLKRKGYNDYATAGIMGNIYAESGLRPNNLQNEYEKRFGMNDEQYTMAVDNGSYKNFVNDSGGYGLAQWTYHSRKKRLLDYAKQKGTSIGDPSMQLDYLDKELNDSYSGVVRTLKSARSVKEASDVMLHDFERPKNHNSSSKINERLGYSQSFYNQFAGKPANKLQSSSIPEYSDSMDVGGIGGADIDSIDSTEVKPKSTINTLKSLISNAVKKNNTDESDSNNIIRLKNDDYVTSKMNYNIPNDEYTTTQNIYNHDNIEDKKFQENIMDILYKIFEQLQFINGNTEDSSVLLDSLNNKDFVDKGLRESINALGKVKKKNNTYPKSTNNTRIITAMARP